MSEFTYSDWQTAAGRLRPDLPPMWLEDLGYDRLSNRLCFHGGCILDASACAMTCIGCQPFAFKQSKMLWAHKHSAKRPPDLGVVDELLDDKVGMEP